MKRSAAARGIVTFVALFTMISPYVAGLPLQLAVELTVFVLLAVACYPEDKVSRQASNRQPV